jgi:hypothetical protein
MKKVDEKEYDNYGRGLNKNLSRAKVFAPEDSEVEFDQFEASKKSSSSRWNSR